MKYDSKADTLEHIKKVNKYLLECSKELMHRATIHDDSKLEEPEKGTFDKCTIKLKSIKYGTDEYKQALKELGPALDHHYKNNSHHPEFYENGINGMDLFDLMEMLMDWKAATERMKDGGDIRRSLEVNRERFKMSDQTYDLLKNTIDKMF